MQDLFPISFIIFGGGVPPQASGAPAPYYTTRPNKKGSPRGAFWIHMVRWGEFVWFHNPPAWLCHAVPPLHKGGFSLPKCIQPSSVILPSAAAQYDCPGTGLGLQPGLFRVMVYHTRSTGANNASPPETGTGAQALGYSTVTDLARLRGLSISQPRYTPI